MDKSNVPAQARRDKVSNLDRNANRRCLQPGWFDHQNAREPRIFQARSDRPPLCALRALCVRYALLKPHAKPAKVAKEEKATPWCSCRKIRAGSAPQYEPWII